MLSLLRRNLIFHARAHLGALLGVVVATAVLVGALAIGDCVRGTLADIALTRLGQVHDAVAPTDHFFRAQLAADLNQTISNHLTAALLVLPGAAAAPDGSARANQVQILGVDPSFWSLAPHPSASTPSNGLFLNQPLARQLHAAVGDTILLRVQKPSLLAADDPLAPRDDVASAFRLTVAAIVSDAQFGRFSLRANAAPPLNAFVSIDFLQSKIEMPGRANLLLTGPPLPGLNLSNSLRASWQLADAALELRSISNLFELRSARVFLDPIAVAALNQAQSNQIKPNQTPSPNLVNPVNPVEKISPPQIKPDQTLPGLSPADPVQAIQSNQIKVLTYFVNELRDASRSTPYSMVTAATPPLSPPILSDDQIAITQWLADDLAAKTNDALTLKYYVLDSSRHLVEKSNTFRIAAILPPSLPWSDPTLMPDFPGIAKAEKTENWDAGFPIDLQKIRPKDEQYWKQFRGTPKAFITLRAGQQMWSNQFGALTAIRFPASATVGRGSRRATSEDQTRAAIEQAILSHLDPATEGLVVRPVRALALDASSQAEDLGQYFAAFSIFIIAAALILLALLFQFGLERRATEIGVLLALGWRPRQVRRLLLAEGLAIAAAGSVLGLALGLLYCRAILYGLAHLWGNAVNNTPLAFHVTAATLASGAWSGLFICGVVIWFALRAQTKRPARELLERGHELEPPPKKRKFAGLLALVSAVGSAMIVGAAIARHQNSNAGAFFAAATLLLIAGLSATAFFFRRLESAASAANLTLPTLALRGCLRRRKRSLAAIALLACGCFLIVAVAANKLDANTDAHLRGSGTGGFAFIAESALPIVQDLNSPAGRQFFGLENSLPPNLSFVPFRVHDGDDASCLNLNHVQTPRLLGVDPQLLATRGAFTFSTAPPGGWLALTNLAGDAIPAIADDASIQYSLHKAVGDTLDYTDEHGHAFKIRLVGALANSVLQGNLIISAAAFDRAFPSSAGAREFLIDSTPSSAASTSATLSRALQDRGFQLTPTPLRLNDFNAVQNAYLDTFEALGALGLLLGSAGLGVIVLRNVLERRPELATLSAVGFRRALLFRLVLAEHASLEFIGLLLGVGAAILALLPALLSPRAPLSSVSLAAILALVAFSGLLWTWLATHFALRGSLLEALHNE